MANLALYRAYRPQSFKDVTGQNHVKVTLQNELETGKTAHAYLFCGPRGVGKTTMARLLAKALNCEQRKKGESEPCNACAACTDAMSGRDLDVIEMDAATHTQVDKIRESVIENARVTPVARAHKIFIIDEVHMLSGSSFNALLKLLEEPPAHAVFILCTTESHKIPATIISRCQRFDFKKINTQDLLRRLSWMCESEGVSIEDEVLADIARHAEGSLRDAESLLGQVLALGEKHITREQAELVLPHSRYDMVIQFMSQVFAHNAESAIRTVNQLIDDGVDTGQFCADAVETLRKLLLIKVNAGLRGLAIELDPELEKELLNLMGAVREQDIIRLMELLMEAQRGLKNAALVQLPLELAAVKYIFGDGADSVIMASPTPTKPQAPKTDEIQKPQTHQIKRGKNEKVKSELTKPSNLSLDTIRSSWHQFLVSLQETHASLTFILKVAEPLRIEGATVVIGFKYPFHKKRIDEQKITRVIEDALSAQFGASVRIATELLPPDYVSAMIEQETKQDEVELVVEAVAASTVPAEPGAPIPVITVSQSELLSRGKGGAPVAPTASAPVDYQALISKLVQTFGGKIVE